MLSISMHRMFVSVFALHTYAMHVFVYAPIYIYIYIHIYIYMWCVRSAVIAEELSVFAWAYLSQIITDIGLLAACLNQCSVNFRHQITISVPWYVCR